MNNRLSRNYVHDYANANFGCLSEEEVLWTIAVKVSYEYRAEPVPFENWRPAHRRRWLELLVKHPPVQPHGPDPNWTEKDLEGTARWYDILWSLNESRAPGDLLSISKIRKTHEACCAPPGKPE